jgi:hypothetical protein
MNVKIYNGTAREINFYALKDTKEIEDGQKLVLKEGAEPIYTLKKGKKLNCFQDTEESESCFHELHPHSPVPLIKSPSFVGADAPPEGYDLYVVSQMFRTVCIELETDTIDLACVSGAIYRSKDDFYPCGYLGLAVG